MGALVKKSHCKGSHTHKAMFIKLIIVIKLTEQMLIHLTAGDYLN